jgi:hypothetical protein
LTIAPRAETIRSLPAPFEMKAISRRQLIAVLTVGIL